MTFSMLLTTCLFIIAHSSAQTCSGTLGSVTYDTVFIGTAPLGNWSFTVQKIPPPKILYAVVFKSSFTIDQNLPGDALFANGTGSIINSPQATIEHDAIWSAGSIVRFDTLAPVMNPVSHIPFVITGPPLGTGFEWVPFSEITHIPFFNDSLTPADAPLFNLVGSGPIPVAFGTTGTIAGQPTDMIAIANYATTEHVTMTLYYCDAVLLALDPVAFIATRHGDQQVDLNWSAADERPGRTYDIQLSNDGAAFSTYVLLATEPGDARGDYSYHYIIPTQNRDNLYFRLKESIPGSPDRYSSIQVVEMSKTTRRGSLSVYPNPAADFVQLLLPEPGSRWQVEILNADGSLVQSDRFGPASTLRVGFRHKMALGTYFVRVIDPGGEHSYTASFFVGK